MNYGSTFDCYYNKHIIPLDKAPLRNLLSGIPRYLICSFSVKFVGFKDLDKIIVASTGGVDHVCRIKSD